MPTVHYFPASQPARAVSWFVKRNNIEGITFNVVDILSGKNREAEYTALTRKYQAVPVLETDEEEVITQSGAILFYLAKKHGSKDLPSDLLQETRVLEALLHHEGLSRNVTKCSVKSLFAKMFNPSMTLEQQRGMIDVATIRESLEFVDGILANWKYIAGSQFTLADYLVAAELTQLEILTGLLVEDLHVHKFANIVRYLKDLENEPGFAEFVAPAQLLKHYVAAE